MQYIEDFVNDMKQLTDAPEMFIRASAYHLLSFYPGRECLSLYGKKLRPNMFMVLSCVPGRGRRSTIANWDNDISEMTFKRLEGLADEEDEDFKILMQGYEDQIIEDGTPEGISDHITKTGTRVLDIKSPEFGSVLSKMNKDSGYAYGLSAFFSRLYYGEQYKQNLSIRVKGATNRNIPRGMYTCMFSGMQEPYLFITPEMIREGLLRRITLCYMPVEQLGNWRKPLEVSVQEKADDIIEKYVNQLVDITQYYRNNHGKGKRVEMVFDDGAMDLLNEISRKDDEAVVKSPSDLTIYLQSTWEQLAKLSMLECIGRKAVLIGKGDVERAISFYNPIVVNGEAIVNSIGVEKPIAIVKRALDRVYAIIYKAESVGMTRVALYRHLNIAKEDLDSFIGTLIEQGKIRYAIEKRGPKNQSVTVYYAVSSTTTRP